MPPVTRADLADKAGRRRAWRSLMFDDHGLVRLFYDNTHTVEPDVLWRTYQPSPGRLRRWRERGIKTVVNLRGEKPSGYYLLEEEACAALGLKLVNFRVFSREAPSLDVLRGAKTLFETIDYPAVMHCKSGADRVGLMAALYLFLHRGRPLDEALKQLSLRYGHVRQGKTGVIDYAFEAYLAHAHARNIDLASVPDFFDWAETDYDPAAIKKDFLGSWWGNLLTEKILRRE